MSVEAITLVLHHSKASGTAKVVLLGIANHFGDEGAWPSLATLAKYANVTERQVQRAIVELENLGEITIVHRDGGSRLPQYKTNRYWLRLACPQKCDGTTQHRVDKSDTTSTSSLDTTSASPLDTTSTSSESKRETSREINHGDFEEFWKIYPRKVGKFAARQAYLKALKFANPENILEGAKRYASDPNRRDAYTAHPTTWLNAGRWEDGPLPERELSKEEIAERDAKIRTVRADREREANRRYLEELNRAAAESSPPPTCEHGSTILRCRECLKRANVT